MRRHCANSEKLISRIDVTAFAGIMFALVAMFLLPATIVTHPLTGARYAGVDLPNVDHSVVMRSARREDALLIAVQLDGKVWFNQDQITLDHLPAAIRERVNHGAEPKVYIRADGRSRYGTVLAVLRSVQSANIENIAFLVNERTSRWMQP